VTAAGYSWRLEVRFGVRRLVLLDATGKELRTRMCQSEDPAVQLAFVEGMILDHQKTARQ
jgi:hypothetical protein